ncbi:unnamed protein product [Nippostrongylus brasiliensis]|uniref:Uncharacterized protein n=1 Tax=Nippostrongylus brasiliensis TaxID=27835 RepID=A0A0N4YZD4_NIPBR|nr:unnamed protein product [Nippostrongylus brasiliensis]
MNCAIYVGEEGKENLEAYKHNRTVQTRTVALNDSKCWTIRKRRYLPTEVPDSMEVHHNVYFLKIVSKNYDFLEEVMTMMYSPLHFYCFAIDSSATIEFQQLVFLTEYLRRALCTWLNGHRFPLTMPRSFQTPLFRFIGEQNFEKCEPLSIDFDKHVALDVCRTNRFDSKGNCIVGMEDYDYTT